MCDCVMCGIDSLEEEDEKDAQSILDIIDDIQNIKDLIMICNDCLCNSQLIDIKKYNISHLLHFFVKEKLDKIQKELNKHV